eukprot:c20094_g1_i1 orf=312-1457(-)
MAASLLALLSLLLLLLLLSSSPSFQFVSDDAPLIKQVTDDRHSSNSKLLSGIPVKGSHDLLHAESHFEEFISMFGKSYSSDQERDHRFRVFKSNLLKAVERQILDPSAVHGITKFSDLTEEEFRDSFLGLKRKPSFLRSSGHDAPILPTNNLPSAFDWRDKGAVSEVKDQGSCGSCWSFSTTGALEGAHFLATGELLSLSEQQLVDCDHVCDNEDKDSCDSGCNGGLMTNAFNYIMEAGGLQLERDYPYTGADGTCRFDNSKIAAKVATFNNIAVDEDQITANLVKHGPLAIGINAMFMQTYIGGVSCPYICSKRMLDHGVLLVGYAERGFSPIRLKEKPYWIIKNSWGANWGDHGYYKLCRGYNECGMDNMVSGVAAAVR